MKNRNSAYWGSRFIQLHEALLKKGEKETLYLQNEYNKASIKIQNDIRSFYVRFVENNKITLQDARKLLNSKELDEFKWTVEDYIKYGKENAINQQWMKELENASIRIRVRRLESLEMQIRQQLELLAAKEENGLLTLSRELTEEGYYRSIYEIQRGFEIRDTFNVLNPRILENIIVKPWAPDGLNFSQRIWRDKDTLINELKTELIQSFIRGDTPDIVIRNISKKMDTSRFVAGRLVMTESAYFASQGQYKAFNELRHSTV